MNKYFLALYTCFLITCITAQAQSSRETYDQYRTWAKSSKEDTNKVLRSLAFARLFDYSAPDTALAITKRAKDLALKLNYPRGIVLSIYQEGVSAETQKDYPAAIRYYAEAGKVAESHKLNTDIYIIYNSSLNIYYYLADYPNAMEIAQKALSLAEKLNDKEYRAYYNNQLGYIYLKQEKPDESIKYSEQYLKLATDVGNRMMVADACNEIGDAWMLKNDYKTSVAYFSKAFAIYDKMKVNERFSGKQSIFRPERLAYTSFKISTAYRQQGDYKRALQYSLSVFEQVKKNSKTFNPYDLASYYINAGEIYSLLKKYDQARVLLDKGLLIARSIIHREDIRDAYMGLSENFAFQKRYDSAYYYHLLFTRLKDSIINEKVSKEINKLEADRRGKEITLLNQQEALKETQTERQNLARNFIIGLAALVAIISFLLLYIKSSARHQRLIFEKQLALQTERQRISSDMHDDIGTGLSTMLIYINMLRLKLSGSADGANIDRISALGNELVEQMKEIVWSLNPGNDRLDNLVIYLRQYFVTLFEPLPHRILIDLPPILPDIKLESETRRNILLCVKESLNNIIKHANATQVEFLLEIRQHTLIIEIRDNGIGLSLPATGNPPGNGLKNMRRRIDAMGGKFNITSDKGTEIRFEIGLDTYLNG